MGRRAPEDAAVAATVAMVLRVAGEPTATAPQTGSP
jgi:hypothetical protein